MPDDHGGQYIDYQGPAPFQSAPPWESASAHGAHAAPPDLSGLPERNDARVVALRERTAGRVDLTHAFDVTHCLVLLVHLAFDMGVVDRAEADFEQRRSAILDKIEAETADFEAKTARAAASDAVTKEILMGKIPRIVGPPGRFT
jgi:hypothetical protein